jgi:isoquinoline 1-oxidoreductase beta subunit
MRLFESLALPVTDASAESANGLDRRDFLKASAAGLVLGMYLPFARTASAEAAPVPTGAFAPNAFIRVTPDNWVVLVVKHHEMGQGTTTGIATLLADELDADWTRIKTEYAPSDPKLYANIAFGNAQGTGGSNAMKGSWEQARKAGATARALLVQAAAAAWKVPASEVVTSKSMLTHPSGKRATYGDFAVAAAKLPVPAQPPLKAKSQYSLIGKWDTRRVDSADKSTGKATYTIDVKLPGLLTAVIARPPTFGSKLKSFDATRARAVPGVTDVVEVPEGVAVVGKGMWAALKGRDALDIEWNTTGTEGLSTEGLFKKYRALAKTPGIHVKKDQQTNPLLAKAKRRIDAVYEFPYLAHAPMEPLNCVASLHDGQLETWSGHQFPTLDHANAAKAVGLPLDKVQLHTLLSGGSFGRRANGWSDYTVEAVNVAKAINGRAPVRVQRTREDDMRAACYRPLYVHDVSVGLDADGNISGWRHAIVGQSILGASPFAKGIKDGVDDSTVEGVNKSPYAIPGMSIELHSPEVPVRPLWWRSVGNTHTAYAMETLMDELATLAGKDAVDFRLALLKDKPRHSGVIRLAAQRANWGSPLPPGRARGFAMHESFDTYVAQVVEVSLTAAGQPKVERVVVAVDCGVAINPDVIRAQMEGGVGFALAAALYGEINIEKGRVLEGNFDDYRVLRIEQMPHVEVHIVATDEPPTGVGEPGVPPLAPAVANAVFKLTGKRIRRLPFIRHGDLTKKA